VYGTMTTEQAPDEMDVMAAEYAMGLLTGEELAEAKRLLATDRAFAQAVTDWEMRLASMTDELAPVAPRPAVKQALFAELFPTPERKPWWARLWLWQGVSALSVLLLAFLLSSGLGNPPADGGPLYTAEIVSEAGDFRVVAVVDKSTNEVFLTRTAGAAPEGRILQVWAHGEGEPATSVGLWPQGDTVRIAMPPEIAAVEGILTLGVSEEPVGGSPTGSPTGRVFGTVDIPGVSSRL
jgi:anti-sigma-K factor RskA